MAWLNYAKRRPMVVDKTNRDAALGNIPLMIYLSAASGIGPVDVSSIFDLLASNANRKKIAVTKSDGISQLYTEIEKWDDGNEKAWLFCNTASALDDPNSDETLYFYYDPDQNENTPFVGDTEDTAAKLVWEAAFKLVLLMAQDPNGDGVDAIKDSTSNANHATPVGTMLTEDLVNAKIGKGLDLDGSDDRLLVASDVSLDVSSGSFTLSIWMYSHQDIDTMGGDFVLIWQGDKDVSTQTRFTFKVDEATNKLQFAAFGSIDTIVANVFGTKTAWNANQWYKIDLVFNGSGYRFYVDGVDDGYTADSDQPSDYGRISIGAAIPDAPATQMFDGLFDKTTLAVTDRSAAWLKAEYYSETDAIITFGAEESNPTPEFASAPAAMLASSGGMIGGQIV